MIHLEITNFQSIKSLSLDFEGFTTIIGRNFIGKSATLRAINAALTNQQGTDFIRWGEKFCEVKIVTKDIKILWHKEVNNNYYILNETDVYNNTGNQPPPKPVLNAGYGLLNVGKEKINLFYAQQFFPLFLVDKLDTKSADFFISVYGLDKLYKAIDLCAKDQRKNTDLLKLRKNDLNQAEKDIERFKDFDSVKDISIGLESIKGSLIQKDNLINITKLWIEKLVKHATEIKKLRPVREIKIPPHTSIDKVLTEYESLKKFHQNLTSTTDSCIRLRKIKSIILPEAEEKAISNKLKELEILKSFNEKRETLMKQVGRLKTIKDIICPEPPEKHLKDLNNLKLKYQKATSLALEIKGIRNTKDSTIKELEKTSTMLSKYSRCPACGAKR